jgi:hypothetical protein
MRSYFDHPWYFAVYAALLQGSVACGFALAHFQYLRKERDRRPTGLEAAIIGLFGLMLSFTFLAAHSAARDDPTTLLRDLHAVCGTYYRTYSGYDEHIPRLMDELLLISAIVIGSLVGFMNGMAGTHVRQMLISIRFVFIVLTTVRMVLDMNNPYQGTIQPELDILVRLRDELAFSAR